MRAKCGGSLSGENEIKKERKLNEFFQKNEKY